MKKLLLILILLITGCSNLSTPLNESQVINSIKRTNQFKSGQMVMNFHANLPNAQEDASMNALIQFKSEPELESLISFNFENEQRSLYFNQNGLYELDSINNVWRQSDTVPLQEIFKNNHPYKPLESIALEPGTFKINPETVMIDDAYTTEITIPVTRELLTKFIEFSQENSLNTKTPADASMLIGLLGDDFLSVKLNVDNDKKLLKRILVDVNTSSPLFTTIGMNGAEMSIELLVKDYELEAIQSIVELPQ